MSSNPGKGTSGDKFLRGVAENIITMKKIVEVTLFQFENFLEWLCLPVSSSISDTAEMLESFCKDVNEATAEVLKDIAREDKKQDQREKVKPENSDKKRKPSEEGEGMRITPDDLKKVTGLKKAQPVCRPSKPAETSTADNELSALLARFNRNTSEDDDKMSEGEPTLTRTVRGVTVRKTNRRKSSEKKSSTSGQNLLD